MSGMSLKNQVNMDKYFSISTIDPERMKAYGINLTPVELRERARHSPYFKLIPTGSTTPGKFRMTKIYRYEDFKTEVKNV